MQLQNCRRREPDKPCIYIRTDEQNDQVQLPVILRIFEENQNPVDMHTSIMCINILQNIKAVAPKLQEEIAGQTMYLYPDGRTDRDKLICTPTLRRGGIQIIQAIFMKSVDHEKFVKVTVHDIHLYRTETWITTYH